VKSIFGLWSNKIYEKIRKGTILSN
jgi:hypothetical protein